MALSIVANSLDSKSGKVLQANYCTTVEVAADTAYPATEGGYDLDALLNVKGVLYGHEIIAVVAHPFYDGTGTTGYFGVWDKATNRLKIYLQASGAEVANDADLSGITAMKLTVFTQ